MSVRRVTVKRKPAIDPRTVALTVAIGLLEIAIVALWMLPDALVASWFLR